MRGLKSSAAAKAYMRKYHQPYRDREPKEVHERLQALFKKSSEIGKINHKWFESTPDIFMAEYTPENGETEDLRIVIYRMDHKDKSHSNDYVWGSKDRKWAETLRDHELPLYTHDETIPYEARHIIQKRLKGDLKEIPIIQHLHDEKVLIDKKWGRIRTLIGHYLEFFKNIVWEDLHNVPRKYDFTKVYVLEVEGTEYHFLNERGVSYLDKHEIKRLKL